MDAIKSVLCSLGVDEPNDVRFVQESDLASVLKIVQARKLISHWNCLHAGSVVRHPDIKQLSAISMSSSLDRRGVPRGACTKCDCDRYELPSSSESSACGYSSCPPTMHEKVENVSKIDDREKQDNAAGVGIPTCNDENNNSAVSVETAVAPTKMSKEFAAVSNDSSMDRRACSIKDDDKVAITYPAPLRTFSNLLHGALHSDDIHKGGNWHQLILEASFYYYGLMPTAEHPARISYVNIGRSMYEKYPSIAAKRTTPWSYFCSSLSSKIRQLRLKRKHDDTSPSTKSQVKPKRAAVVHPPSSTVRPLSAADFEIYKVEMKNALLKKNLDNEHVKTGMTETFRLRRETYLSPADCKGETTVKKIYADFPAFQQYQFVLHEMALLRFGDITARYEKVLTKMAAYFDISVQNPADELEVWKMAEAQVTERTKVETFIAHLPQAASTEKINKVIARSQAPVALLGDNVKPSVIGYHRTLVQCALVKEAVIASFSLYHICSIEYHNKQRIMFQLLEQMLTGRDVKQAKRATQFLRSLDIC